MNTTRIASHLNVSPRKAAITLAIIRGSLDPLKYPAHFPQTEKWANSCYNPLPKKDVKLSALNELLGMFGVEAIRDENTYDDYYGDCIAEYLNTGDSYAPTIVLDHTRSKWTLTSWGDFVENMQRDTEEITD